MKFPVRLDRFVSHTSGCSRSEARAWIRAGRVCIDRHTERSPAHAIAEEVSVTLDGKELRLANPLYLMLNKPSGILSATRDDHQATVLGLLPADVAARVHLVGRLDKETTGLLLLSDDGTWSHRIASPRHRCAKVYLAELESPLVSEAEQRLAQGMLLRGESKPTLPAQIERLDGRRVRITVHEGRYHLVRRLFAALGNHVTSLHRERIGGLELDPRLAAGEWRELTASECQNVFACTSAG
jgi:16S rRNA pseudouridine516 synthase